MPTVIILLILLPGYLFLRFTESDKVTKYEENWKLLLKIGVASLFFISIARVLILSVEYAMSLITSYAYLDILRYCWGKFLPIEYSFTVASACILALLLRKCKKIKEFLYPAKPVDAYSRTIIEVLHKDVLTMVETKNGKIYIGTLTDATLDIESKDEERIFEIAPHFSGKRESEGSLKINTRYSESNQEKKHLRIVLPYREILSYRKFDPDFFLECVQNDLVKVALHSSTPA